MMVIPTYVLILVEKYIKELIYVCKPLINTRNYRFLTKGYGAILTNTIFNHFQSKSNI